MKGPARPGGLEPDLDARVHTMFERWVAATPDAVALVSGTRRISYAELNGAANRIGRYLTAHGLVAGAIVALALPRGFDLVAAILAVLKAGAGYALVDARLPAVRQHVLLADSGASLLMDQDLTTRALADKGPDTDLRVAVRPDAVACVVFTSGARGRPQGVVVPHRALTATYAARVYAAPGGRQVWLQWSRVSSEAFGLEIFAALTSGGTCVLYPDQQVDALTVAGLVAAHRVTRIHLAAGLAGTAAGVAGAIAGAEAMFFDAEDASAWVTARQLGGRRGLRLVSTYGPLESFGLTAARQVTGRNLIPAHVPIGVPIARKGIRVLDEKLQPTAAGRIGELWAVGAGLAHGYARQPGLTAERFVPDPFGEAGSRMYRTGDLGYLDPAGGLHLTGRSDDQVKIRGFRVEPGDVAHALHQLAEVKQAAVVARVSGGEPQLAAYVTTAAAAPPEPERLRAQLARLLPDHMIPASVTVVPELPKPARDAKPDPFAQCAVVVNHEEQCAIWPGEWDVPIGWRTVSKPQPRAECVAEIDEMWADIRPLSLRRSLGP
ncbi:MAG TPA: AMP-binding protein [Thermoleophilia bacterium]|jgi:amino acid adenylation domain-containing protein|nr:AMP-binding protein [Thermoleophilia bacterium]